MSSLDKKPLDGEVCVAVFVCWPNRITWKFEDGSEVETDFDLSTDTGRHDFAKAAEKLGFGHRRDLVELVEGPILDIDGPAAQGPRAILQRPLK